MIFQELFYSLQTSLIFESHFRLNFFWNFSYSKLVLGNNMVRKKIKIFIFFYCFLEKLFKRCK